MKRACKIARESENNAVRKSFFEFMEELLEELEEKTSSDGEAIIILNDMRRWCASVYSEHDILLDIEDMLEELEGR